MTKDNSEIKILCDNKQLYELNDTKKIEIITKFGEEYTNNEGKTVDLDNYKDING